MQSARMIIAIVIFVAAAVGSVFALVYLPKSTTETPTSSPSSAAMAQASKDGSGFFYQSIGQGDAQPAARAQGLDDSPGLAGDEATKATYTLELAMKESRDEAESLIEELRGRGIDAYYTPLSRSGRIVYRVRRGMFPTLREAKKAAVALQDDGAKVVKLQ